MDKEHLELELNKMEEEIRKMESGFWSQRNQCFDEFRARVQGLQESCQHNKKYHSGLGKQICVFCGLGDSICLDAIYDNNFYGETSPFILIQNEIVDKSNQALQDLLNWKLRFCEQETKKFAFIMQNNRFFSNKFKNSQSCALTSGVDFDILRNHINRLSDEDLGRMFSVARED